MDSEERHELKENDLAEFFRNFGQWWSQYGNTVLIAIIIVAGGITAYNLYNARTEQQHDQAWGDLMAANTPEAYAQVAETHANPVVQSLAHLRGADLYRRRAIGRYPATDAVDEVAADESAQATDTGETDEAGEQPDATEDLAQAAALYRRVLEQNAAALPAVYRVNALLGLAAVAESQKQWDEARGYYDQAIELADQQLPQLAEQARDRRELLDELRRPIVFAPEGEGPQLEPGLIPNAAPNAAPGTEEGEAPMQLDLAPPTDTPEGEAPAPIEAPADAQTGEDAGVSEPDAAAESEDDAAQTP